MTVADRAPRRPRHRSIRWRLPLLICALLLAALTALGWAAYGAVRQVLLDAGRERLSTVSEQVGRLLDQAVITRLDDARVLASLVNAVQAMEARDGVLTRHRPRGGPHA